MHLIDCYFLFFCFLESNQGASLKVAGVDTQVEFANTSPCRCFTLFVDTTLHE